METKLKTQALEDISSIAYDITPTSPISLTTSYASMGLSITVDPPVSSTVILTLSFNGYMSGGGDVDTYTKLNDGTSDIGIDRIYWRSTSRNTWTRVFVNTAVSSSTTYTAYIRVHTGTDTLYIPSASLTAIVSSE